MLNLPELKTGDCFCTHGNSFISKSIRTVTKFWSSDNDADFNHGGTLIDPNGATLEALSKGIVKSNISLYIGSPVLIVRPKGSHTIKEQALKILITEHLGQCYPWWRIALHTIPPLAKFGPLDRLVCTELVAKYLYYINVRHDQYKGTSPDTLADEFLHWKEYKIIFQGTITI